MAKNGSPESMDGASSVKTNTEPRPNDDCFINVLLVKDFMIFIFK